MEELESKDLIKYAQELDHASTGCETAVVLLRIARKCMTGLPPAVKSLQNRLEAGAMPSVTARTLNVSFVRAILSVAKSPTPSNLLAAVQALEGFPLVFVHRSELWELFKRSIVVRDDEGAYTTEEAAVIVRDRTREDGRMPQQRTISRTLLVKGLEYDHVILYGFVSGDADRFREIARGVEPDDVQGGELENLRYARARDKGDRSLEIYKFHVNALYVAVTRAVRTVYLVEPEPEQRIFDLLGISRFSGKLDLEDERSSLAEWSREARKLERQGKAEQAADIRERLLGVRAVPWEPLDRPALDELDGRVADGAADRKSMLRLYEYALLSRDRARLGRLMAAGFQPALAPMEAGLRKLVDNRFPAYSIKHSRGVRTLVEKYGPDHRDPFNCTPLMLAARFGHGEAVEMLTQEMGADLRPVNTAGLTAFQVLLQEISLDERRARRGFGRMYRRLCPADVSVMVNERLVKLDGRKAEFLFLHLFAALFATWMADNVAVGEVGLRAADLVEFLGRLPDSAVPAYRKRRAYISSVLARNEVDRDLPANRRIFRRTERGVYILNPEMSVRVENEWVRIHDLLDPEVLLLEPDMLLAGFRPARPDPQFDEIFREHREELRRRVMKSLGGDPGSEVF